MKPSSDPDDPGYLSPGPNLVLLNLLCVSQTQKTIALRVWGNPAVFSRCLLQVLAPEPVCTSASDEEVRPETWCDARPTWQRPSSHPTLQIRHSALESGRSFDIIRLLLVVLVMGSLWRRAIAGHGMPCMTLWDWAIWTISCVRMRFKIELLTPNREVSRQHKRCNSNSYSIILLLFLTDVFLSWIHKAL